MSNFFINITKGLELKEDNESNANILEDVLDLSILILVLKELGEPVKLTKSFHFNQYRKLWYVKSF